MKSIALILAVIGLLTTGGMAGELPTNAEFTAGSDTGPEGWRLEGGQGRWVERQILEVTGNGQDSSYWRSQSCDLTPGALYHFQVRARRLNGTGSVIAGPSFANRDYFNVPGDWKWLGHVFRVSDQPAGSYLRVGHWHAQGTLQFDAVRLTPCLPVHKAVGNLLLGEGESIRGSEYRFLGTYGGLGSNFHRTLVSATASFNSDRWNFGGNSQITYRFEVPGCQFQNGECGSQSTTIPAAAARAEVSRDQKQWRLLTTQEGLGSGEAALPAISSPPRCFMSGCVRQRRRVRSGHRIEFRA